MKELLFNQHNKAESDTDSEHAELVFFFSDPAVSDLAVSVRGKD